MWCGEVDCAGDGTLGIGCIMELGEGLLGSCCWFIIGFGDREFSIGEDGASELGAGEAPSR